MSDKKTKKSAKVKNNEDLSKYIPSDYESPLGIEYSKKETKVKKSNQDSYDEVHGSLYKMAHNNTIPWRNYLIYGILLTLLTCAFTFSKYASQLTSQEAKATVAGFGYTIQCEPGEGFYDDIKITDENTLDSSQEELDFSDEDVRVYKLKIHNSSDVTVTVTPSYTLGGNKPDTGDFDVSFYDNANTSSKEMGENAYITIPVGQSKYIYMKIDSSSIKKKGTHERTLNLKFDVVQVD